jgi:hypothetical protein
MEQVPHSNLVSCPISALLVEMTAERFGCNFVQAFQYLEDLPDPDDMDMEIECDDSDTISYDGEQQTWIPIIKVHNVF